MHVQGCTFAKLDISVGFVTRHIQPTSTVLRQAASDRFDFTAIYDES